MGVDWLRMQVAREAEAALVETSDFMRYHWSSLRSNATASQSRITNWAKKPALVEVRERILRLPEPVVADVRIEPSETGSPNRAQIEAHYKLLFDELRTLIELTRAWDSKVPGRWKVRYYQDCYCLTLEEFRNKARDTWLQEFFQWASECSERRFGLYLDY